MMALLWGWRPCLLNNMESLISVLTFPHFWVSNFDSFSTNQSTFQTVFLSLLGEWSPICPQSSGTGPSVYFTVTSHMKVGRVLSVREALKHSVSQLPQHLVLGATVSLNRRPGVGCTEDQPLWATCAAGNVFCLPLACGLSLIQLIFKAGTQLTLPKTPLYCKSPIIPHPLRNIIMGFRILLTPV